MVYHDGKPVRAESPVRLLAFEQLVLFPIQPPPLFWMRWDIAYISEPLLMWLA
jgi:hypothetical protein